VKIGQVYVEITGLAEITKNKNQQQNVSPSLLHFAQRWWANKPAPPNKAIVQTSDFTFSQCCPW